MPRSVLALFLAAFIFAAPVFAREWKSANGKFSVQAEFVGEKDGQVQLKKASGEIIEVALDKLSEADRQFVASTAKSSGNAPAAAPGRALPIAERLNKPAKFEYTGRPLKEAIEDLKELLGVPIVIDLKSLQEGGIGLDAPVTGKSGGKAALDEVNALLRPLMIAAEIHYDVLLVATPERFNGSLVCRAYRVVKAGDGQNLAKLITTNIAADTWDNVGGAGSIANLGPVLVISQTQTVHREIEQKHGRHLVASSAAADRLAALVPIKAPDALGKMRALLRRPCSAKYIETPLEDVLADLAKRLGTAIELDAAAVQAAGVSPKTPVSINLPELPLESVLTLILQNLSLTWAVQGEKFLITTPREASKKLITVTYEVRDLTAGGDFDTLIDAITSTLHPASWQDVGGPGSIKVAGTGLTIGQTLQGHRQIESWLADVRLATKSGRGK